MATWVAAGGMHVAMLGRGCAQHRPHLPPQGLPGASTRRGAYVGSGNGQHIPHISPARGGEPSALPARGGEPRGTAGTEWREPRGVLASCVLGYSLSTVPRLCSALSSPGPVALPCAASSVGRA